MFIKPKSLMKIHSCLLLILLASAGCATTSKDFKSDSVQANEGAIYGHVKVIYNGQENTDHCSVCFDSVNGPCLKLDQSGVVVMKVDAGETSLRRIACVDTSTYHYNVEGATFVVAPHSKTYFGDVTVEWSTKGGFKVASLFGAIGAGIDEASNDGTLVMHVSDQGDGAEKAYRSLAGDETRLTPKRSIVLVGK